MTRPALSVAVIGLGSRGLGVLERIVTLAKSAGPGGGRVRVEVVDPLCDGAGVHAVDQPDYLLLNTTCEHVSLFPDAYTVGDEVDAPGPNLLTWATERGLRLGEDGFTVGPEGRPLRPTDFLPRRLLGEYLGWFRDEVLSRVPDHVTVVLHRASAVDLTDGPGGSLIVTLSDGATVEVDHAFLTTGYTPNEASSRAPERLIAGPYPLPEQVAAVAPGQTVAISGLGLSGFDVMSALTVGRGGRFFHDGRGGCRYEPSGREPVMLFSSRSGVPCRARPLVTAFGPKYVPLVFTHANLDGLRVVRGGRLDFEADVMPLVYAEVRIAYRRCEARLAGGNAEAELMRRLHGAADVDAVREVLDDLDRVHGVFDPVATFHGVAGMPTDSADGYEQWLVDTLRADLDEGVKGFAGSPLKAGLDVMRDLRDTFRYAVDFGGLTPDSLHDFHARIVPMVNRAVVGPQFERHAALVALIEAGLARAPFGPAPSVAWDPDRGRWRIASTQLTVPHEAEADWVVAGFVDLPSVSTSASPLLRALRDRGRIRPYLPGSSVVAGLDIDADQHPRDAEGVADPRVWVIGPLCEGATFYNNLVPSPAMCSRVVFDAHRCVAAMYARHRVADPVA